MSESNLKMGERYSYKEMCEGYEISMTVESSGNSNDIKLSYSNTTDNTNINIPNVMPGKPQYIIDIVVDLLEDCRRSCREQRKIVNQVEQERSKIKHDTLVDMGFEVS